MSVLDCFKAYDIRGRVPEEMDNSFFYKVGEAYAKLFNPKAIVIGYDARLDSEELAKIISNGLVDNGVDVFDLGLCGTEEIYFHSFDNISNIDGGMMITASHNPKGYNGIKMVGKGASPMSLDSGIGKIKDFIQRGEILTSNLLEEGKKGRFFDYKRKDNYIDHLLTYTDVSKLKKLKIAVNPGNGTAGPVLKLLEKYLPFEFVYINENPDGNFPNGVPNPMLVENRKVTSDFVKSSNADIGIAWDGDFDRCFLFDENGDFIEGYYIVGLLADSFLKKSPGEKVVHDPRLIWNTIDIVKFNGGTALQSKCGHSYIKDVMRANKAIYGGEMSSHHYFRDFGYCDSGMIPWLLITELLSITGKNLSELIMDRKNKYFCIPESNYKVHDSVALIKLIEDKYTDKALFVDKQDGLGIDLGDWRFNIRSSNTEPLIRLNIESKIGKGNFIKDRKEELEKLINLYR